MRNQLFMGDDFNIFSEWLCTMSVGWQNLNGYFNINSLENPVECQYDYNYFFYLTA
jgi:hypothetical protein